MDHSRLLKRIKRLTTPKVPRQQPAYLGDSTGLVAVPGRPNYVYAHLLDGTLFEAYNDTAPLVYNLPVFLGHRPGDLRLQVLRVRDVYGLEIPPLINHGHAHTWAAEHGGHDLVYVHPRQHTALRPMPGGDLLISVASGYYPTETGFEFFPGGEIDLAGEVPVSQARWTLVTLDTSTGDLAATNGTGGSPLALTAADIPAVTTGHIPLMAVLLKAGQLDIMETRVSTDVIDLRTGVWLTPDLSVYALASDLNDYALLTALDDYAEIVSPPSAASDPGEAGQIAYDSSYIYVCVATDTWLRAPIATW